MFFPRLITLVGILVSGSVLWSSALAESVVLQPFADTTLIEISPDANMGGADFFNTGTAGNGYRNRALMLFDVASEVPVGAIIQSVTLTLDMVRQPPDWQPAVLDLHRVNVSWGEGIQVPMDGSPGLGAPAQPGEATWLSRFNSGLAWGDPGGKAGVDYQANASSSTTVFGFGDSVVFEGSAAMIADVQLWADHPDQNFGWMLKTADESLRKSARGFASHENGGGGPMLSIQFTTIPEPSTWMLLAIGGGLLGWRTSTRARIR